MARIHRVAALKALWTALRATRHPGVPGIAERLAAVPRMVALVVTGRYREVDLRRVGLAVLGLVYVLSPLDLAPEMFLGLFGVGDDAAVLAWVFGAVLAETGTFLEWEHQRRRTVVGEVVH